MDERMVRYILHNTALRLCSFGVPHELYGLHRSFCLVELTAGFSCPANVGQGIFITKLSPGGKEKT